MQNATEYRLPPGGSCHGDGACREEENRFAVTEGESGMLTIGVLKPGVFM